MHNRQFLPFGCLMCASNRTPDHSSGRREVNTSCGWPRAKCRHRNTRIASTIHGRIDKVIFKFDRRISSGRGHITYVNSSFRASSAKFCSKTSGEKHNLFIHFPQRPPSCEVCKRTKVTRPPCRMNPDDRADRNQIAPHSSQCRPRIKTATQTCSGLARCGDAMDSELSMQDQIS